MERIATEDSGPPEYENFVDSVVAFVDILGFDSRVRNIKAVAEFSAVAKVVHTIYKAAKNLDEDYRWLRNIHATAISDSLIVTIPFSDPFHPLIAIVSMLRAVQYIMLTEHQTLLRGFITSGPVYHKNNIIFGRGYSDAYKGEQNAGHAPRIVFDPLLVEEAKSANMDTSLENIFDYIIEDPSDGEHFVDYLRAGGMGSTMQESIVERQWIRKFIQERLVSEKDRKIIRKYKWLQNYFLITEKYVQ